MVEPSRRSVLAGLAAALLGAKPVLGGGEGCGDASGRELYHVVSGGWERVEFSQQRVGDRAMSLNWDKAGRLVSVEFWIVRRGLYIWKDGQESVGVKPEETYRFGAKESWWGEKWGAWFGDELRSIKETKDG